MLRKTIGMIAPDVEMRDTIVDLYGEEVKRGEIKIKILQGHRFIEQARELEEEGVKAIIARSGVYDEIQDKVKVPVVRLKKTITDILQSVEEAKKYSKELILVLRDDVNFEIREWKKIIDIPIVVEKFHDKEEIELIIESYMDRRREVVIIGSGMATRFARMSGMDAVFINARKDAIKETVSYTKELITSLHEEIYKTQILKKVLNNIQDAVIAIDEDRKVILYNKMAQDIMKKAYEEVMYKDIAAVFPNLEFLSRTLKKNDEISREIKSLNGRTVTVNTRVIRHNDDIYGTLLTFQDITKVQKLEHIIRYKMNKKGLRAKSKFEDIVAKDEKMISLVEKAKLIGATDGTIIIYGESGTGKEIIAQSIHNHSSRSNSPFVAVNCAALSETLLESELFGYEEGAFTGARKGGKPGLFELAHGGTVFLDEINSISKNLQSKLLRVLEEKEVMRMGSDYIIPLNVRIISAANEELKIKVKDETFRRDLFYRLNILEIDIPPLRNRKKDIVPIFEHFFRQFTNGQEVYLEKSDEERLLAHNWLGNVRELKNVVQRYQILGELQIDNDLGGIDIGNENMNLKEINKSIEEGIIRSLHQRGFSKKEIAGILGVSRTSIWKKMK